MASFGDCETLRLKFQRDLNCLADHDRMVRRKGMQRLKAAFQDPKTELPLLQDQNKETVVMFFNKYLRDILVKSFGDSLEFCRESAAKLVLMFATELLESDDDLGALCRKCVPALVERVGISPSPETTEEIRFLEIKILETFVTRPSALNTVLASDEQIGVGICAVLVRSLGDLYPEVKRLCAVCIRHLVSNQPSLAITAGADIMKGCVMNLGHQHAKTRQLTIQALGQLVVCCAGPAAGEPSGGVITDPSSLPADMKAAAEAASGGGSTLHMNDVSGFAEGEVTNEASLAACLKDVVLPAFHKLVDDTSASVRLTFARCAGFLIRARPLKTDGLAKLGLESKILTQLLSLTNDVADEVQRASFEALVQAATHWSEHNPQASASLSGSLGKLPPRSQYVCSEEVISTEESAYLSLAVCALVASHAPAIMGPLIDDTSTWTVRGKVRALDTLKTIALISRGNDAILGPCLHHLVSALGRCLCDDEDEVVNAARRCTAAIGCGSCAIPAIELSLPRARGEGAGMDTPQTRTAGLLVAAALLDGSSDISPVVVAVSSTLSSYGILLQGWDTELGLMDRFLAAALLQCCEVLVRRCCEADGGYFRSGHPRTEIITQMLLALCYLQGIPTEAVSEGTAEECVACLAQLAETLYPTSDTTTAIKSLYEAHLPKLLDLILSPFACSCNQGKQQGDVSHLVVGAGGLLWDNTDPSRRAFDAVLRSGVAAAGPSLVRVVPVITAHVTSDCKPDLKLSMMCLLEALLEQSGSHWPPLIVGVVNDVLMHNMVWKAGRVASTVRKVAIACFYSLLHRGYADRPVLFKVAPPLLPVLKTDLDDYDASTRELVCLSLDLMFRALPLALSEQPVLELYPALLKRLDDSSDRVRFAVCGCFLSFLKAAPPSAFYGTTIDYTLDQLLVHLDDVDPAIQERIFKVLRVTLTIDAERVGKKAAAVRSAHRSPVLIDQLITLAKEA